jgi:tRNA U34 5-carboxymethylaminomethyl modifying GTPase MnmE/TrmE
MTICAISTAPGVGGIAVIRISGEQAFTACDAIFKSFTAGVTVSTMAPNTIRFGQIVADNELVDEVLVSVFHAPHSFTGENVVEIACHGSQFIQQEIKIGFNAKYITDILTSMTHDKIDFELNDHLSPGLMRPHNDTSYTCVVMPMRI